MTTRRDSFERQKLRSYRGVLANCGEPVEISTQTKPLQWRRVIVSITPERRRDATGRTVTLTDRLEVFGLRDETDVQFSGVANLVNGMRLRRTASDEATASALFSYRGELLEQGGSFFRAIFERDRKTVQGRV